MATKVYAIYGKTCATIRIPISGGKSWLECEFAHGTPSNGINSRPATLAVKDPVKQSIIETSQFFPNLIKLLRVHADEPAVVEEQKVAKSTSKEIIPEEEKTKELQIFEDVTSFEEAVGVLKRLGAKATQLRSPETIKKAMVTMNISFPNYELD